MHWSLNKDGVDEEFIMCYIVQIVFENPGIVAECFHSVP